jgi:uncharacterized caspase-like protein
MQEKAAPVRPALLACLAQVVAFACAAPRGTLYGAGDGPGYPGSGEKGGLVPLDQLGAEALPEDIAAAHAPRRLALLIGISQFDDGEWRPLRYAAKDARDLGHVLSERTTGNFAQATILADRSTTARKSIEAAFRDLASANADPDDTVLVYVSSHGTLARDHAGELKRYLVARDTKMSDVPATGIAMDDLAREFEKLRSRRKVLVLATCHSGSGKSTLPADVAEELQGTKGGFFVRPIEEVSKAAVVLAACDWGETAREDDKLANDIYTHFFLEALEGDGDRNGDGAVTASEAHDLARRKTYYFTDGRQRPSAESREVGADPIVLSGAVRRPGLPELYSYSERLDGFQVRVDGEVKGNLPGGVAVDPGERRITLVKGGGPALYDGRVKMVRGERLAIEEMIDRARPRFALQPRVGVGALLSPRSEELAQATPLAGFTFFWRDALTRNWGLQLDAAWGAQRQEVKPFGSPVTQDLSAFAFGLTAAYTWDNGPWRASAGPRLSVARFVRSFDLPGYRGEQPFGIGGLGATGQVSWAFAEQFELNLGGDVSGVLLELDGDAMLFGYGEAFVGIGYRF